MGVIDADWIYEKVENRYRLSSGIEHRCERDLLDLICSAPEADVVPKSEVDKIENAYNRAIRKVNKNAIAAIQKAKQEVVREIFEEIEKIIKYSYYADELGEWHDETLLLGGIDELKKKYTEG